MSQVVLIFLESKFAAQISWFAFSCLMSYKPICSKTTDRREVIKGLTVKFHKTPAAKIITLAQQKFQEARTNEYYKNEMLAKNLNDPPGTLYLMTEDYNYERSSYSSS